MPTVHPAAPVAYMLGIADSILIGIARGAFTLPPARKRL